MERSLRMRRVSRLIECGSGKIIHVYEITDPNFSIHLVTFRSLRRRLSHVLKENSFFHCDGNIVHWGIRSITQSVQTTRRPKNF